MLPWALLAVQLVAPAIAQRSASDPEPSAVITIRLGSEDVVSFRQSQRVVTHIDLRVRSAEYSVPLQCAGGLRDVHFETAELSRWSQESEQAEGTFALFFDMGAEQERRFGKLPRVQISFYRRRVTEMLLTRMTGPSSGFSSKLCASPPVGPITCKDTRQIQGLAPDVLVQQLRELPKPFPSNLRAYFSDTEKKRRSIYEELLDWGADSIPPLVAGLQDPDVRLRRNVVLALGVLSGGWWPFECGPAKVDIRPALSTLVTAFRDPDQDVRAWAAQAAGNMGPSAADAVAPLTELLTSPGAKAALPALRTALSDQALSRCAARAIQRIEQ